MKTLHLLMSPGAIESARHQIQPGDQWVSFGRPADLGGLGYEYGVDMDAIGLVRLMNAAERIETW